MPDAGKLALAERHVAEGEERVSEQRSRLDHMRQRGLPTDDAEQLLKLLEQTLLEMRRDLERLRRA